jgi:hypothetical protein
MRHQRKPHQCDLFDSQPWTPKAVALPVANRAEAVLLLGRLLHEIVRAEAEPAKMGGGHEQDHR